MTRVDQAGEAIERLLAGLRARDGAAAAAAEELTGLLVGVYGDGLSRVVALLRAEGEAGLAMLATLAADPLVSSLLVLHDLHPLDVDTRIQRALDQVRPYLGSHAGGVQYLGVTDGVARLRLEGSCHGCPSSTVTVRLAISGAVAEAAPEISEVVVEGVTAPPEPALLQIVPRPDTPAPARVPATGAGGPGDWVSLPGLGPPSARPVTARAAGLAVCVCAVRGTLYAYRDACPACGSSLGEGTLDREVLACGCGARYDVTRAGRGLGAPGHLDPLPLLADSQGVRVAVPAAVPS
jgi:Fe-S cluster biogenesis protein NfuA/nitrite reductase/ring-hydroxylating ferredoxin subunit